MCFASILGSFYTPGRLPAVDQDVGVEHRDDAVRNEQQGRGRELTERALPLPHGDPTLVGTRSSFLPPHRTGLFTMPAYAFGYRR